MNNLSDLQIYVDQMELWKTSPTHFLLKEMERVRQHESDGDFIISNMAKAIVKEYKETIDQRVDPRVSIATDDLEGFLKHHGI